MARSKPWNRKITVSDDTVTSAADLTLRQSLIPNLLVTILFFLWGFAYGLLDVLNSHFRSLLSLSASQAAGLSSAYFGAYFLLPPTLSAYVLRRFGFRITFMLGLMIFAVGCLLFWPSGLKQSFGGFCGSMFVVGAGLATLETAADPFLSICGPTRYSEVRLNLAQAVQGVGSFVAPLLASRVFFAKTVDNEAGLKNVQWVYLGVAGFDVLLIVLFFFVKMPEITGRDMEVLEGKVNSEERKAEDGGKGTGEEMVVAAGGGGGDPGPFRKQINLFLAVWSQFCYVGAQVAVANYFIYFCEEAGRSTATSSDLLAVGQGLYALNRFVAGGLLTIPAFKPRYMLAVYLGLCFVFAVAAMNTTGTTSIAMLMLVLCFESCCFATIFTLGLRGLGRHTKLGGSLLVAAISGGMVFPPMMGAVVDAKDAHTAMAIPMMGYILAWVYPLYVNVWNRDVMDSHREARVGVEPSATADDKAIQLEEQPTKVEKEEVEVGTRATPK
ncbi:Glucose/galactose transporter [Cladorrhinum samala]|uniref:Glucose/galactose transporter n=1 Tax=Cladorrhinum samala TaxID=585594 RepID=A0AAV9HQX6_9PEZI|nr:Glucose/galactose transporter [Cladorrhinum samala]